MTRLIVNYFKNIGRAFAPPIFFIYLWFFAFALKSQTAERSKYINTKTDTLQKLIKWQIGFNLNPIISQTSSTNFVSAPNGYVKLEKTKLNYSVGVNFTYYFNNKFGIFTGVGLARKSYTFMQDKFSNNHSAGEKAWDTPIYHTIEIPLLFVYKINLPNEKNKIKILAGVSFDLNNFNTYKNGGSSSDTLSTTGQSIYTTVLYPFAKSYAVSGVAGFRFEKLIGRIGSIELGLSYHYCPMNLAPFGVTEYVDKNHGSEVYTTTILPKINYIGFDIVYYFYRHQAKEIKTVPSF